jgi:hypothetical protein
VNAPQNVQDARSEEFVSKSMIYPCRMFAFVVEAYSEQSFATLATRHAGNSPPSGPSKTAPICKYAANMRRKLHIHAA